MQVSKCRNYDYDKKEWTQIELDLNLKTYPCCFWYWEKQSFDINIPTAKKYFEDELIHQIHSECPNSVCIKYCNNSVIRNNTFYNTEELLYYINEIVKE